jgi:hypothetical protein
LKNDSRFSRINVASEGNRVVACFGWSGRACGCTRPGEAKNKEQAARPRLPT